MYRTSIKGRRDLVNILFEDSSENPVQKIDNSYTSRVAEIFQVILKSLSIGLDFMDSDNDVYPIDDKYVSAHELNGHTFMCTEYQFFILERIYQLCEDILREEPILTNEELEEKVFYELKNRDFLMGPVSEAVDELKDEIPKMIDQIYSVKK